MVKFVEIHSGLPIDSQIQLLHQVEPLHRQLRPKIPAPYDAYIRQMLQEGASIAFLSEDDQPRACAVWRIHHTTFHGLRFYVDDLITDEQLRSHGHGKQMLDWLQARAQAMHADSFDLETGIQRAKTHKFYFREGLGIFAFSFAKPISDRF